eukprot:SAG11_NODE_28694_length_319_cov_0.381818_1_plen_75_part_10
MFAPWRAQAAAAVSVWCSKGADGDYACVETRRRLQSNESASELRLLLPMDISNVTEAFEETLLAELNSLAGLFTH